MKRFSMKFDVSAHKFAFGDDFSTFGGSISLKKRFVKSFAAAHSRQDALTAFETRSQRKNIAHSIADVAHDKKTLRTVLRTLRMAKKHCAWYCGRCAWRKNTAHGIADTAHGFQDARTAKKTLRMIAKTLRTESRTLRTVKKTFA